MVTSGKPWRSASAIARIALRVPLGIRDPPVPVAALLRVAALLLADEDDGAAVEPAEPGDDRPVVRAAAIAVQLEEVVEDPLDVVERVRPILVPRQLDRLPDLVVARLLLETVDLVLEPLELAGQLRPAEELHGAELTEPLAQAHLGFARHAQFFSKRPSSCDSFPPELRPRDDRVEVAEAVARLGEPEVVRQLLARRLRDDPRAREGHERARLRDRDVAEAGEAREHSAPSSDA